MTLNNSAVEGNVADEGGGIYNDGGTVTLNNSTVSNHNAALTLHGGGILNDGTLTITNSTISNNMALSGDGGGISNEATGNLLISESTIDNNTADGFGGGVYNEGLATLTNVTISTDEINIGGGGGIYNDLGPLFLLNVTLSNNQGTTGDNIFRNGVVGVVILRNTIVANPAGGNNNCVGGVSSLGNNLDDDSTCVGAGPNDLPNTPPNLGPLQDNGGPTWTHALLPGSPAIDAGDDVACPATDQRGVVRPQGSHCDIGAYERQRFYVDADAFTEVQSALAVAVAGDDIWVAEGVYRPDYDPGSDMHTGYVTATFVLTDGVALYGGFDPSVGADTFAERDWQNHVTVLSGDLGGDDGTDAHGVVTDTARIAGTNAQTVVMSSGVTETAVLDGFTVTAGNADGSGGEYWQPHRSGGGMYNLGGSPTLAHVTFSGNRATYSGGGMFSASWSSPRLTNCVLWGNSAGDSGGQIYNIAGSNPVISYSLVQGGCPEDSFCNHLRKANPLFVRDPDPGDGDWTTPDDNDYGDLRLRSTSPAIDAGNNNAVPADTLDLDGDGDTGEPVPYDLGGDPRFFDVPAKPNAGNGSPPIVDMGAYERQLGSAPLALDDAYTTPEDTELVVATSGLLANDSDMESDPLAVALDAGPSHGALTFNTDGSFSYDPALDYHGVDTFTYAVSDTIFTATATVTVTTRPVNDVPVIAEGATTSVTMDEDGAPALFDLTLHASDVDSVESALAWSVLTPAGHGTASAGGTGPTEVVGYAPDADYNGSDSFVVQVSDGALADAITVSVTITPVNDPPTISDIPDQAGKQNTAVGPVPFAVGDVDDPPAGLALLAETSDAAILPVSNVAFGGAGADRTVTVTPLLEGTVVVTVTVNDGSATASDAFTLTVEGHTFYLPLVYNNYTVAPDLVVERVVATADDVQVVIANRGSAPAVDDFWVDVYLDPDPAPTHVNQIWPALSAQGLAWGVTVDLAPGEVLTLTVGGDHYVSAYSHVVWSLPVGTQVYAQVDSANAETIYGAVLESHEITGSAYNNVAGPFSSTTGDGARVLIGPSRWLGWPIDLPRRTQE